MTPTPQPRTAAGRALLADPPVEGENECYSVDDDALTTAILAIEAEAAAPLRAATLRQVRAWVDDHDWRGAEGHIVFYDALVAFLDALAQPEREAE